MISKKTSLALLAPAALAILVVLPVLGSAATIGPANYQDINVIIQQLPASVTITADNQFIYLNNTDNVTEAVVVFYPQFDIKIYGLDGAYIGVWNGSAVVARSNISKFDLVIQLGGGEVFNASDLSVKMGSGALALIIPPLTAAKIARIEYSLAAQGLSAPSPPSGYQTVDSRSGVGDQQWQVDLRGADYLWVAFKECSTTSCDYDLEITDYANEYSMVGMDTQWETRTFRVSGGTISIRVYEYRAGSGKGETWQVILAAKASSSSPTPVPTNPPPDTSTPSASFPELDNAKLLALGAGLFFVVLVIAVAALARR